MAALAALGQDQIRIRTFRCVLQPAGGDALMWTRSMKPPEQYDVLYLVDTPSRPVVEVDVVVGSHLVGAPPTGRKSIIRRVKVPVSEKGAVLIVNARTQWRLSQNRTDSDSGFMLVRYVPRFPGLSLGAQEQVAQDFPAPPRRWWGARHAHALWPLMPPGVGGRPKQRPAAHRSSGAGGL